MKNLKVWMLALVLAFTSLTMIAPAHAAEMQYHETALDNAWDWATTLGKSGLEKEKVLAENKSERMKRYAEKVAKEAQKEAGNAAADAKKKLGF